MKKDIPSHADDLQKIASGVLLFSLGTLGATSLQFIFGILIVRSITQSEFGIITLANTFVSIGVILSVMGFGTGLPRLISKRRNPASPSSVHPLIQTAVTLVAIAGAALTLLLYSGAHFISLSFGKPALETVLKHFSFMILPLSGISLLTAIFRGYEITFPKIVFQDIALNLTRVIIFVFIFIFTLGFTAVIWGYVFTAWIILVAYWIYAEKKNRIHLSLQMNRKTAVDLIRFSFPLIGMVLIDNLTGWLGPLSLGFLSSANEVGIYSAPQKLSAILNIPLTAFVFIYLPIATQTYESRSIDALKALYASTCKWIFVLTAPLVIYFLIDAEFIVTTLFGASYLDSANVLRILTVGYIIHVIPGPNSMTLVSSGKSYTVLAGTTAGCVTAIISYLFLVPPFGAAGAATATAAARLVSNLYMSTALFKQSGIHPFAHRYGRILPIPLLLCALLYLSMRWISSEALIFHLTILFLTVPLTFLAISIIRGINKQDIRFISGIEMRLSGATRLSDWLSQRL